MNTHNDKIVDQFTRQAAPFSASPQIRNEEAIERILAAAHAGSEDTALDVACGPGILACALAKKVRHVTGIDLTPRMLEKAKQLQAAQSLSNMTWQQGDVTQLPFADGIFSIVTSRFAFHHFQDPLIVLKEMARVCKAGGMIVVIDSAPAADKADAFNTMERLRDPSHTRSLPPEELTSLFRITGLAEPQAEPLPLAYELDSFLARSFPAEGAEMQIREMFSASLVDDRLGVAPRREDGKIVFTFPTVIAAVRKGP